MREQVYCGFITFPSHPTNHSSLDHHPSTTAKRAAEEPPVPLIEDIPMPEDEGDDDEIPLPDDDDASFSGSEDDLDDIPEPDGTTVFEHTRACAYSEVG